jgi:hypothetical protein
MDVNTYARNGDLNSIINAHNNNYEFTTDVMNYAVINGHLDIVKWLHFNRNEGCTIDAIGYAASNGDLHVVKWLHTHRNEGCTTDAMNNAAYNGHLHVVKWLHTHRNEGCTTIAMNWAAYNGHFNIVIYLLENNLCKLEDLDKKYYENIIPYFVKKYGKLIPKLIINNVIYNYVQYKLYSPKSKFIQRKINLFQQYN